MQSLKVVVQFLQELLHLDAVLAENALRHFQSCVRTTLLLCNGYECQEKVSRTVFFSMCTHVKVQSLEASMCHVLACACACAHLLLQ